VKTKFLNLCRSATLCFIASIAMAAFIPSQALAKLTAVITRNNDFTTEERPRGKVVPVPEPVERKIDSLVDKVYARFKRECGEECRLSKDFFYGPIFRITAPSNLEIHVFRRMAPLGAEFFFFIVFDPVTKKITQEPAYIFAKWMSLVSGDVELQLPLLSFDDVDGDGQKEILIRERVRNGTMYNAIVHHYYHLSADLALHHMLAVETGLNDLFTEDQDGTINRTVQKIGRGQLRVVVDLEFAGRPSKRRNLGEFVLRNSRAGEPFRVVARKVFDPNYAEILVTASGESESAFIRDGYRFYY
jgi:hypothetical protein